MKTFLKVSLWAGVILVAVLMLSTYLTNSGAVTRTIWAGSANGAFTRYTIVVPAGWTATHRVGEGAVDVLVLTEDGGPFPPYLVIYQGEGDSGQCHYAGETGEGRVFLGAGISIIGTASEFMRGSADGDRSWTICEKGTDTFSYPTTYGYITYDTHMPWGAILAEMDGMVASLTVVAP